MAAYEALRGGEGVGRMIESQMSPSRIAIRSDSGTGLRGAIAPVSQIR
jgi:hypothetical protein